MKINDAIFGIILAVIGVVVLIQVQGYPTIPGQQYGPGLFPGSIAAGFIVCGVLLIASGLKARAAPWVSFPAWLRSGRHLGAFLAVVGGVVAYLLLAESVGFLIVAPLLLLLWFRTLGVRWPVAVAAALLASAIIWFAFYKMLRVPLPWGVLTPYAF
jgi:putative tricarboxylic transport membrane protein